MFIIYDLVFLIVAICYLPIYLFGRKFHSRFLLRLGFLPQDLMLDRPIWVHAVSVGEAVAIRGLIEELRKVYPDKRFVISTVTPTGNKIAKDIAKETDLVTYLPLDLSFIVRRVIDRINPSIFIITETELWPNVISYLYRKKIPIIIVNGRVSDKSFRGYLMIKFLIKFILGKITLFCVQTERDAERLICLGAARDKIKITGNMKFDIKDYTDCRSKLKLSSTDRLIVAGSTHPGEEEIILQVYKDLVIDFPNLKLLIAPRDPQRSNDVSQILSKFGFRTVFVSQLSLECSACIAMPVFILDTVGELISFYTIADIVFVGGSLIKKGGHNILEPAFFAKAILFGPYIFNFRDIADLFLNNKAAIMIKNYEELKTNIIDLLNNPYKAAELGQRALGLILKNQGATLKNVEYIVHYLKNNSCTD